jgi:hypothetical protein
MDTRTAKSDASKAGLELYYDTQWRAWGLIDPCMRVGSEWLSPGELRSIDRDTFNTHFIEPMLLRIKEHGE